MILENEIALGGNPPPAAYQIERSLRFNSTDSTYLAWVPPQAGNRRTWTWSGWVKRSALGAYQSIFSVYNGSTNNDGLAFTAADKIEFYSIAAGAQRLSTAVYRDVSAWYHVVLAIDTPNATAQNRARIWVNGVEITVWDTNATITQNTEYFFNSVNNHHIGRYQSGGHYNGYITEVNFIDGQALTPSDFGETSSSTGVWIPKAYTGSYGQNGFYLPFNDNSAPVNLGRNRQTLTADPYFPYTTLLLNGNQPSGVTDTNNNVFKDSSSNNFTITRSGATNNTTQGTFSPFSQTGWSNYFNAAYLSAGTSSDFSFAGNFTIEMWYYSTITTDQSLILMGSSPYFAINVQAGTGYSIYLNNATPSFSPNNIVPQANTWNHVALVRSGSTVTVYHNGTALSTTATNSSTLGYSGNAFNIGWSNANAYISNLRVVNGTAVYTSNFTPSTTPLTDVTNTKLLTCQSNRFVDTNTQVTAKTITVASGTPSVQPFSPFAPTAAYSAATNGGSGYFDGTGDFLSYSGVAPGTGAFTLECWFYNTGNFSGFKYLFGSAVSNGALGFRIASATSVESIRYNVATTAFTVPTMALNAWNHIVLVRDGSGNETVFLNGVRSSTGIQTDTYNYGATSIVGALNGTDGLNFTGYISGAVVATTALYSPSSTTITVPTAPPSPTGTALCLNFTNAGIYDSASKNVLETVGNAQISTTQSKFGGSSMYFDGNGDNLIIPNSPLLNLSSGDFTIEAWVYQTVNTVSATIVQKDGVSGSTYPSWKLGCSTGKFSFAVGSGNGSSYIQEIIASSFSNTINVWYHIAAVKSGSTLTLYIDGVSRASATQTGTIVDGGKVAVVGYETGQNTSHYWNGYIQDLRITRGVARYTGNFTVPAAQFAYNQADINVKQWVPNNFSVTAGAGNDSLVDSPTNYGTDTGAGGEVRGNYATLNVLNKTSASTLSNGNLDCTGTNPGVGSTIAVSSGKWYFEAVFTAVGSGACGITVSNRLASDAFIGLTLSYQLSYQSQGKLENAGSQTNVATFTSNDIIACAFDCSTGSATFYKNGTSLGTVTNSAFANVDVVFGCSTGGVAGTSTFSVNYGQRPFAYTAPSGFKALCTQNLPTPAIGASASTLASKNFNVVTYTGDGSSSRNITGVGFAPDFVWFKNRASASFGHRLYDIIRGATKELYSHSTAAEFTETTGLTTFGSDGYTVGSQGGVNENGSGLVTWNWKANGAGVSNTAGSITSTVSASTTAGFSVVTWTGNGSNSDQTVGTGLSTALDFIITKPRDTGAGTDSWLVYTSAITLNQNEGLILNSTAAKSTNLDQGTPSRGATAGLLLLRAGTGAGVNNQNLNKSGIRYVSYCFHQVPGFSKFGSYTGNGSADGPFVYCGFRPRWVIVKQTSAVNDWMMYDTARSPYNIANLSLYANLSNAEATETNNPFDIVSNGFKLRGSGTTANANGGTYIFMAFAESPFNYSRAR